MVTAPHPPTENLAQTGRGAWIGAVCIVVLIAAAALMATRADAAQGRAEALRQAALPARTPAQIESERIRSALIRAQANAERVWRAMTPPDQQRRQQDDMLARFRSEDASVVMMQRIRQLGETSNASSAAPQRRP